MTIQGMRLENGVIYIRREYDDQWRPIGGKPQVDPADAINYCRGLRWALKCVSALDKTEAVRTIERRIKKYDPKEKT